MTQTYTRTLTYGQVKGIYGMTGLLKKLGVKHEIEKIVIQQTVAGQPGFADTFRIRIKYVDEFRL